MNNAMSELLSTISSKIVKSIDFNKIIKQNEMMMQGVLKSLKPIMDEIKDSAKILAKRSLELGFYPSNTFILYNTEFLDLKSKKEEIEYLCNKIESTLCDGYLVEVSKYFNKKDILKCYSLYNSKDYESCILNLIVIINQIFINEFGCSAEAINQLYDEINCNTSILNVEFETKYLNRKKAYNDKHKDNLVLKHRLYSFEDCAYYIFAPYYNYTKDNTLFKTCYSNEKEYRKIPYNRNGIMHGFVDNYGTRENCLRWFSVIINTYELIVLYREMMESAKKSKGEK